VWPLALAVIAVLTGLPKQYLGAKTLGSIKDYFLRVCNGLLAVVLCRCRCGCGESAVQS
jgi:hypothetical protein